jgi:hypothetical protein
VSPARARRPGGAVDRVTSRRRIFGPLTDEHRWYWDNEHHFHDDPADEEALGGTRT